MPRKTSGQVAQKSPQLHVQRGRESSLTVMGIEHTITEVERIEAKITSKLPADLDDATRKQLARQINALAQIHIEAYHMKQS